MAHILDLMSQEKTSLSATFDVADAGVSGYSMRLL